MGRILSLDFSPRVWKGWASQAAEKPVGFSCPVRARVSSRGQRPRKVRRSSPDPAGVAQPQVAGGKSGVRPCGFDPFRVGLVWASVFRGRCPRLLHASPAGDQGGTVPTGYSAACEAPPFQNRGEKSGLKNSSALHLLLINGGFHQGRLTWAGPWYTEGHKL